MSTLRVVSLSTSLVGVAAAVVLLFKPLSIVRVGGFWSSTLWTFRSWLANYPITGDYTVWRGAQAPTGGHDRKGQILNIKRWQFLQPFFASRGYHLYAHPPDFEASENGVYEIFPTSPPSSEVRAEYPHAAVNLLAYGGGSDVFYYLSPYVFAARDKEGHEIIIKAVSGAEPTNELQIMQLLHSPPLCDDSRNRTIPVLEYIEFNKHVFAVMPRWGTLSLDLVTVRETVKYGRDLMEAVAFLHENNITHNDLLRQNMVSDALVPDLFNSQLAGLAGPERKYALIDFGAALLVKDGDNEKRELIIRDAMMLARSLQMKLKCILNVLPGIVDLLDSMQAGQLDVCTALAKYDQMCSDLSEEDMERQPAGIMWQKGEVGRRKKDPVYVEY